MEVKKINVNKTLIFFLFVHLIIWTLIPSISNNNLPLDTIEALAWASDIQWGYTKHPPLSALFAGLTFKIKSFFPVRINNVLFFNNHIKKKYI